MKEFAYCLKLFIYISFLFATLKWNSYSIFGKKCNLPKLNKEVFSQKLLFLLFLLNPDNYEGVVRKKVPAIKVNLSAANAPPPKGYYLFLLADGLGDDTFG